MTDLRGQLQEQRIPPSRSWQQPAMPRSHLDFKSDLLKPFEELGGFRIQATRLLAWSGNKSFSVPPAKKPYPLATTLLPPPPAHGNYKPTFCFYGFAYYGHFIQIKSHNTWSFISGFFHLPMSYQDSPMLW